MKFEQLASDIIAFETKFYDAEGIDSGIFKFFGDRYPQIKKILQEKYCVQEIRFQ